MNVGHANHVFDDPSFVHLLRTGELGPLSFSLSLDELLKLLGRPYNIDRPFKGVEHGNLDFIVLYYDNLIVSFFDKKFRQANVQFKKYEKGPKYRDHLPVPLHADWYTKVRQMDMDMFVHYVKSHGLRCQQIVVEGEEPCVLWLDLDQGGIEVIFEPEYGYKIYQITIGTDGPGNRRLVEC